MRTVEVVKLLATLVAALGVSSLALERRFLKRLVRHGATSPEAAMHAPARNPLLRWRLARLRSAGAVGTTEAGAFFLRPESHAGLRAARRRRTLVLLGLLLAAAGIYLLLFRPWA